MNDQDAGYLLLEALQRAIHLRWRTISVRRLIDIVNGNMARMPPSVTILEPQEYQNMLDELEQPPEINADLAKAAEEAVRLISRTDEPNG